MPLTQVQHEMTSFSSPTIQRFTSGSGTYTTPANVKYIRVKMIGGGGGGAGIGTSNTGGTGGTGGNTLFQVFGGGSTILQANGGSGGLNSSSIGGAGGSGQIIVEEYYA